MAMTVKKNDNEVRIQWRVADIKIPTNEIKHVSQDQDKANIFIFCNQREL